MDPRRRCWGEPRSACWNAAVIWAKPRCSITWGSSECARETFWKRRRTFVRPYWFVRVGTASHIRMSPTFSTIWLGYSVFLTILIGESRRTCVLSGGLSAEKGLLSLLRVCKHFMTLELKRGLNLLTACLIGKKITFILQLWPARSRDAVHKGYAHQGTELGSRSSSAGHNSFSSWYEINSPWPVVFMELKCHDHEE